MAWYKTGTVSVTNASTTVTGSGTNFVSGAQVGEAFQGPDGELYEITAIGSATSLTITPAYGGSTASGQSYAIVPTQSLVADLASDVADLISDYQTVVDEAGAGKFGDGSAASPSIKFTQDQDTGVFRDTANEIAISAGGSKIGSFTANGLELLDNEKAIFGAGSDLQIYHDGSNSRIYDQGTGALVMRSNQLNIQSPTGEKLAIFNQDSDVELYYDNSQKLATTSTGVDISGSITADGLTVDGDATISSASPTLVLEDTDGAAQDDARLQVGASVFNIKRDADNLTRLTVGLSTGDISFYDAGGSSQSFFWDASAERLGLGTTSPAQALDVNGNIRGVGASTEDRFFEIGGGRTGNGNSFIDFIGDTTYTDYGARIIRSNSGPNTATLFQHRGTGPLSFRAQDAGIVNVYTNNAERMRVTSAGDLLVGKTSAGYATDGFEARASWYASVSDSGATPFLVNRNTDDGNLIAFYKSGSAVGSISVTGSATAYNTSSDHRLKENVVELTGATDRLKQIPVHRFNFIADPDTTVDGFLAHEVQSVVPEAITGTHNEVDADGNPVYQGIDQSKLVPLLVATIKELEARITALEAN